uniref:Uncharacterized protein n=1 Tax=Ananas comosus var. bracteatus TaxID=296719 RepID=A0A6V7PX95_ANACO|nr:unnamed protein product [Ananas comosus var. bracteatus]
MFPHTEGTAAVHEGYRRSHNAASVAYQAPLEMKKSHVHARDWLLECFGGLLELDMLLPPSVACLLSLASTLAFQNESNKDIRYALLEASTVSGILHVNLYLDAIILPYYTGIDALSGSRFSDECPSCLCKTQALNVWEERFNLVVKSVLEGISWVFVASDCVYMMNNGPEEGAFSRMVYGGLSIDNGGSSGARAPTIISYPSRSESQEVKDQIQKEQQSKEEEDDEAIEGHGSGGGGKAEET